MTAEDKGQSEWREHVWNYFSFHAEQRLKTFNFFVLLVTVILGGALAFLKDAKHPAFVCPIGILLIVLSRLFWKLDQRNTDLIHHSEGILKRLENTNPECLPELKLFDGEERKTADWKLKAPLSITNPLTWWQGYYTYGSSLSAFFVITMFTGLLIAIGAFFLPPGHEEKTSPPPMQQFFIGAQSVVPTPQKAP